jgi:hypothetical protein
VSFEMSSEASGNECHASTSDVPNAPGPHSENSSSADGHHRLLEEDVQEDYYGEVVIEVGNALEAGRREGNVVTRGQESFLDVPVKKLAGTSRTSRDEPFRSWLPRTKLS